MKTAVFLMNLGGPRNLDEVEPYLFDLFSDPLVLDVPLGPLRKPLARLISSRRAPSSAEKYQLIGGRSPLVEGTEAQARALQSALGDGFGCHLAMRCGHPNTEEAVRDALAAGAERALALPLYPQWANATTRSSLLELRRVWPREKPLVEVCTWHDHPGWLDALAGTIREALAQAPAGVPRLVVFSAHGLPLSQVKKGDPYPEYVLASSRGAAGRCGLAEGEWKITYQSKVGPAKWLGPDTVEWVRANARGKAVICVPVAFVSEHLETLYDMDILAREAAQQGGAAWFGRAPAVGARPGFVGALADLVRGALASPVPAPR